MEFLGECPMPDWDDLVDLLKTAPNLQYVTIENLSPASTDTVADLLQALAADKGLLPNLRLFTVE